jgi:hypothetical protein
MDKQSKKLQALKEESDKIFQEALSDYKLQSPFKKKEQPAQALYEDDVIVINSKHKIMFLDSKSRINNPKPNYGAWTKIDWSSDNFNWMIDAKFIAEVAQLDGKGSERQVVRFEKCDWKSGDFRGGKFIRGVFNGGTFVGQFGPGSKWNTSPFNFIDGTTKEKETILGIPNITNLNKEKFSFNIIAVTPGNKIKIDLEDGTTHLISVVKRLDGVNSIFSYDVINGATGEKNRVNLRWAQLRGQNSSNFKANTMFTSTYVPEVMTQNFKLPFESKVVKVEVDIDVDFKDVQWSDKGKGSEELATSQETYDLVNSPLFGVKDIPGQPITIPGKSGQYKNNVGRVFFNFRNNDQLKGFQNTVKNLESKVLRADLIELKSKLKNGIIDGAPAQYPYLAALIGPASEEKAGVELDPNFQGSLSRIESMLRDFVDTMVLRVKKKDKVYDVENEKVKEMVKKGLKVFLGLEEPDVVKPKKVKAPKATAPAKKVKKVKLGESGDIREAIRKIIENM